MTEEQIRQAYNQLYLVGVNDEKLNDLVQIQTEAEQLGLKDWVQLIEARLAWVNGEYKIAIDLSTSLLERPKVDTEIRAMGLIVRGISYYNLYKAGTKEERADYTSVIEMHNAPAKQKVWALYDRAISYAGMEPPKTEEAIADYTTVIEMRDIPDLWKVKSLINRGLTYVRLEPPRIEDAINDYTTVIKMKVAKGEEKAKAYYLRGNIYKKEGKLEKAKENLLEAKKVSEQIGDKDAIKSIDFILSRLDVSNKDLSEEDKEIIKAVSSASTTDKRPSIEDKIIKKFRAKKESVYKEYKEKYEERKSKDYIEDKNAGNEVLLAILKGWGSAVPLIFGGEAACRGGGYCIKFNGKGLVVDPGYDFLRNFHDQKFHLQEVDAVLVSHNHPDHTHDLKSIDDVKYEIWVSSEEKPNPYTLVFDIDTDISTQEWTRKLKDFRKPPIHADANRKHDTVDLNREADLPFVVGSFKAEHTNDVPNAVGYRVSCMKEREPILIIGFSCDTKYFPELCNSNNLGDCDILVAHMSQPTITELDDPDNAEFKENHLGYRGTIELIKQCKPKLTIVSEFWAGLDDARIMLLQGLRKRCKTDNILPGGVGLLVKVICKPMSFQILCTNCKKWTQHEKIKVGSSSESFGPLNYLCTDCCL